LLSEAALSADGRTVVWTELKANGQVHVYDVNSGNKPLAVSLPSRAVATAIPFLGGVLTPLDDGSVVLLPRDSSSANVAPFLPPLVPDALPKWTKPVALADERTFVISDGRETVYAVTRNDNPRPHLAAVGQTKMSGPITSPLVAAGSIAFGVIRLEGSDAIGGFDARGQPAFEPLPLQGRVEAGPFAVGGLALVAAEPDGLVCIGGDGKSRWQQPLSHGPLAGPVIATPEGDLVAAHQSGVVSRLDAASGKELANHDVGEALQGPACIQGQHVFLAGSDGVVHRIAVPQRP
jgi:hypothetical protein